MIFSDKQPNYFINFRKKKIIEGDSAMVSTSKRQGATWPRVLRINPRAVSPTLCCPRDRVPPYTVLSSVCTVQDSAGAPGTPRVGDSTCKSRASSPRCIRAWAGHRAPWRVPAVTEGNQVCSSAGVRARQHPMCSASARLDEPFPALQKRGQRLRGE